MKGSFLILLLLPLLLFWGCTTSSSHNRGSLSDAMDKARDDNGGSREVPDEEDPWWEDDHRDDRRDDTPWQSEGEGSMGSGGSPFGEDVPLTLLFRTGSTLVSGPYFSSQERYEFLLGWDEGHLGADIFGGLILLDTNTYHLINDSIKEGAFILEAGLELRYYPLESLKFFTPYVGARGGGIFMVWTFQNPLESGGVTISSDALGGILLGVCAGVDLVRTEHFRLGAQISPEAYLYGAETSQGFENDVFDAQGSINWSVEGGFRF